MENSEIAEAIGTRRNRSDAETTRGQSHDIVIEEANGDPDNYEVYEGQLSIEYVPGDHVLTADSFDELAGSRYLDLTTEDVERVLEELYTTLVDLLYPKHSYMENPWESVPMLLEVTYSRGDVSDYYCSIGSR